MKNTEYAALMLEFRNRVHGWWVVQETMARVFPDGEVRESDIDALKEEVIEALDVVLIAYDDDVESGRRDSDDTTRGAEARRADRDEKQ